MNVSKTDRKLLLQIADAFFLDTEHDEIVYVRLVEHLKKEGWDKNKTHESLIQIVIPAVSSNLGFLIYPVIGGVWEGFEEKWFDERIADVLLKRSKRPRMLQRMYDKGNERYIKALEMDKKLLEKL